MAWISLFLLLTSVHAAELQKFYTKHSSETLRYISMDGRYAYVQKKPGVLGLVSSFRSVDFLSEANTNDFLMKGSRYKGRLTIESIPHAQDEMSLFKNHKVFVVDYGNTVTRHIGFGRNSKLHLKDEWISFYNTADRVIHIVNLVTQKKFEIKLSRKQNPFFIPDVEMINSKNVIYTDINEAGFAALVSYDLENLKSSIIYKAAQTATRLELCRNEDYAALGEFSYEGVARGSKIQTLPIGASMNLTGFTSVYTSVEQDIGNIVCLPKTIYFVKTMNSDKVLNHKTTEAVKLDLKSENIEAKTSLKSVAQIIEMDGRVMIPFRGEYIVIEGTSNIGEDTLRSKPAANEELQIDI